MEQLKVFNFKDEKLRTLTINNQPYFVGKDVAKALGYERPDNAIRNHVEKEDKLMHQISALGQSRNMIIINESGLYSLILSSKLPQAKEFKRWVTGEVLPAIRKTGEYKVNEMNYESSPSGVRGLIKEVSKIMNNQGSSKVKIAEQTELILNHYGIETIKDFVEKQRPRQKQIAIAFIETEL